MAETPEPENADESPAVGSSQEDEQMVQALLDVFLARMQSEHEPPITQEAIIRFAAVASQVLLFDIAAMAREVNQDVEPLVQAWIADWTRDYLDKVCNRESLRNAAGILGQPELGLRFDRGFRRSLFASLRSG
jgi:hypothetical protein